MKVFYVLGSTHLQATVNESAGLIEYSKKTIKEFEQENPNAVLMDFQEANKLIDIAIEKKYVTLPILISKDVYYEQLEVLPPLKWITDNSTSSFMISEFTISSVTAIYAKIGQKYYFLSDHFTLSHDEIIERCKMSEVLFSVKNDSGFVFNVKIIKAGDKIHSTSSELVHSGKPIVEFYDKRYDHTSLGQFVSSHFIDDILETADDLDFCLNPDSKDWSLSGFKMRQVKYHLSNISL